MSDQHPLTASPAHQAALSILVADDDPVIRKLFTRRLSDAGHRIDCAVDGKDAARKLGNAHFDLLLTDLVMPGDIGGIELIRIARDVDMRTEIIVMTAHSSVDTAVAAMKLGAADYLEKPVNFDELFLKIDKIAQYQSLMKNAGDLREAMTVTESEAGRTIQEMEIRIGELHILLDKLTGILDDNSVPADTRLRNALMLLKE